MMLLVISRCGAKIQYRRKSSSETRRPEAFIKINSSDHLRMKHGNKSTKVIDIEQSGTIQQNKILILTATADHQMRIPFLTAAHPRKESKRFHNVRMSGEGWNSGEKIHGNLLSSLRGFPMKRLLCQDHDFLHCFYFQFDLIALPISHNDNRSIFITHIRDVNGIAGFGREVSQPLFVGHPGYIGLQIPYVRLI